MNCGAAGLAIARVVPKPANPIFKKVRLSIGSSNFCIPAFRKDIAFCGGNIYRLWCDSVS
jgi:hypothetical protein